MSALRSFYGYYFKHRSSRKNPTLFVDMPKLHEKAIVRLDTDEVASSGLCRNTVAMSSPDRKKVYYEKTKTGIWRLSHCPLVPESVYQNVWDLISRMLILKITDYGRPKRWK